MDNIITGVFALAGALIGGLFTLLAARVGYKWEKAKSTITKLCRQVSSYYKLEELYKVEVSRHNPESKAPKTVQQDMRDQVEILGFDRPTMTAKDAKKIMDFWN
jgi:hypothetical protein